MNINWTLVGSAALTAALGTIGGYAIPSSNNSHILPRHAVVAIQACQALQLGIEEIVVSKRVTDSSYDILAVCTKDIQIQLNVQQQITPKKEA